MTRSEGKTGEGGSPEIMKDEDGGEEHEDNKEESSPQNKRIWPHFKLLLIYNNTTNISTKFKTDEGCSFTLML